MKFEAFKTALIPSACLPPCTVLPINSKSIHSNPLCAMHISRFDGSPTIAPSASIPLSIRSIVPMLFSSSSATPAKIRSPPNSIFILLMPIIAIIIQANGPFMSFVPLPINLSPSLVNVNASGIS